MKKLILMLGIVTLLICVGLSGCEFLSEGGAINVDKLDERPIKFINMSEQQMEKFPHLKQAINQTDSENWSQIDVPMDERNKLRDFFGDTYANIYYQGE